jgi:hypothetical protein
MDTAQPIEERQTGVTTAQMTRAPQGAIYVWPNSNLNYPRRLADHLGRRDLKIVSAASVCFKMVVGMRVQMVADHATTWTDGMFSAEKYLNQTNP